MELSGEYKFKAPIDQVWQILMSQEALQASLPGCEKMEEVEHNVYDVTMKVGVASIKGTYNGRISMTDTEEPKHYKLLVSGQGGPGFLNGEGVFDLTEHGSDGDKETAVAYKGKANVGGTLAGIGSRMLTPVAKKLASDFFKNMEKQLKAKNESSAS